MADLNDIINTLIAEAYGEGDEGMRRVGETILNRSAIRGIDPVSVVRQPSQYTGYFAPGPDAVAAQQDPIARAAAEAAWQLAKQPGDPTNGADHYFNPSIVNPGWQNSMVPTGDFGGHSFYRSRQVPADALAALLAPSTRDVAFPRARPNVRDDIEMPRARPQSPGDQMAALFGGTFKVPQDAATASALDQYLARQTQAGGNLTMPGQINRSVAGLTQKSGLAEALAAMLSPGRPANTPASTRIATDQRLLRDANQQAADAERNRTVVATIPTGNNSAITSESARRAADQFALRSANQQAADAERNRTVVATVPTSNIGKPPTTRVVQSVPVATAKAPSPLTIGATPNFAGQDRAAPRRIDDIGSAPAFSDLALAFGNTPQASGSVNNKKPAERLPAGGSWTLPEAERLALHGIETPAPVNIPNSAAQVQLPRRRPDTPPKTQVAITQPRRVAPTPAAASMRPPQGLTAPMIQPRAQASSPLRITVQGGNYSKPAPGSAGTRMDQLLAHGFTRAGAYEALNAAARGAPSLEDRITGRANGSDGTAQSISG